jgi:hypothetical protein
MIKKYCMRVFVVLYMLFCTLGIATGLFFYHVGVRRPPFSSGG